MEIGIVICKALKHLREVRKISQEQVHLDTEISVENHENSYRMPGTDIFITLSEYYDFDPARLVILVNTAHTTDIPIENLINTEIDS